MNMKGITYDTGMSIGSIVTRPSFYRVVVEREMQIMASDLGLEVIRITGDYLDRVVIASNADLRAGLTVWFSPFTHNLRASSPLYFLLQATP